MEFQSYFKSHNNNDRTQVDRKRRRWRTSRRHLVTFLSRRIFLFIFYSISLIEIINLPFQTDASTPKYETAYACEGKTLTIECGKGSFINLIRANYGRFSITICNDHGNVEWSVNCMSYKSLRVLQAKCEHQQNCSVLASTNMFGDPCQGTHKYLEAHYQCIDASYHTTTTTLRPSIPPWLITSQPSVWSTSTIRPPRITTVTLGTSNGISSSTLGEKTTQTSTPISVEQQKNETVIPNLTKDVVVPSTTMTTDVALETKTSLLFNNAKPIRGKTKEDGGTQSHPGSGEQLFCGPTQARGLFWNFTRFNDLNVQPCPPGANGLAKWRCQLKLPHLRMLLKHIDFSQDQQQMRLWAIWQNFWTDFDGMSLSVEQELDKLHWFPETQPDLTGCYSLWITNIESRLKQTNLSLINQVNDLTQVTNNKQLYGGDLLLTIKIIKLIYTKISHSQEQIEDPKQREQVVYELLNGTLKIFSNLIDKRNFPMWQDLSASDRKYILTELLIHLEENSFLLAELIHRERQIVQKVQNILLSVRVLDIRHMNHVQTFPDEKIDEQQWHLNEDRIEIPRQALLENNDNGLVRIVFVAYDRLERILRPAQSFIWQLKTLSMSRSSAESDRFFDYVKNETKLNSEEKDHGQEDEHKVKWRQIYDEMKYNVEQKKADSTIILNSKIISASLGRGRHVELSHPVIIHFKHLRVDNVTNPICVFWNFIDHAWSDDGCRVESTNATHTICSCNHLTNFALLMVQKQTAEVQFFSYMNENNHLQQLGGGGGGGGGGNGNSASSAGSFGRIGGSSLLGGLDLSGEEDSDGTRGGGNREDSDETDSKYSNSNKSNNKNSNNNLVEDLADFKKIILKNYERILSKHWDFLSSREVRELSPREQEEIFEAWKEEGLVNEKTNLDKRKSNDLIRNEFLRLKNFSKMRKMLVLIKNSLFWKMKYYNSTSQKVGKINWKDLPRTGLVKQFVRSLIKFRDTLRDGKMENEIVQHLDLVWTERQENAFIVRFIMLNGDYIRRFVNGSSTNLEANKIKKSFRELNSFFTNEELNYISMLRQQRKEDRPDKPDAKLMDDLRAMEKDDWFSIEDVKVDEITDNSLDYENDNDELSTDDNIFLFQLLKNNTSLRLFIYLSIVFCVAFIIIAIVLLKVYHGSMFKVNNRTFVMKNIYVCLVAFQVLFLIGIEHENRDVVCGINALLFHFFALAIVLWLCLEAHQLYSALSKTEDFLNPHFLSGANVLDMNYSPNSKRNRNLPLRIIYCSATYGSIIAILLVIIVFGGYELMYVRESTNCLCLSRIVFRIPSLDTDEGAIYQNQTWIPLEPRILSSTQNEDSDFPQPVPVANNYFYVAFLLPICVLFLVTLFYVTVSIFKIYKKYCQYQSYADEDQIAQMLRNTGNGLHLKNARVDNKIRPNIMQIEKERLLINGIRFYLRGCVIFLLVFSVTWIFGYAFINKSPHSILYGFLFAFFNLLIGVYVLLFVCVQNEKFQNEFQKWRRRRSLMNNGPYPQNSGSDDETTTTGQNRRFLDSLCCCLNMVFHPQQEKHYPIFDSASHQVEIRPRDECGPQSNYNTASRRMYDPPPPPNQFYMPPGDTMNVDGQFLSGGDDDGDLNDEQMQYNRHLSHQNLHNYMNNLDAGGMMTGYGGGGVGVGGGYYAGRQDPYNHMQNFEHVMHRKESLDRRVEDELWRGSHNQFHQMDEEGMNQHHMMDQEPVFVPQTTHTHMRSHRRKKNHNNGTFHGGESASSYSVNRDGEAHFRGERDEPIYEEILNNIQGGGNLGGSMRPHPSHQNSRHLSAFLNEKSNSVISCLEPIK